VGLNSLECVFPNILNPQGMAIDQKYDKIFDWLKRNDPSSNHTSARNKHEPGTGNWFIESEAFDSWTKTANASLWLHGIPGAGKTILCSTIIEHVTKLPGTAFTYECAYFYFDFNDPQKRTVTGMLWSIITQLCLHRPQLPPEVQELYTKCDNGKWEPDTESLIKTVLLLFKNSERIYLVMDALDECAEHDELFDFIPRLRCLASGHVNLLVTSREERDIANALQDVIEVRIGLESHVVDGDIRLHVQKCLATDKRLGKWNPHIRQEIQDALVQGAHGM